MAKMTAREKELLRERVQEETERRRCRDFFFHGGAGFEGGEDGVRAVSFSFEGMIDCAIAYAQYCKEEE